MKRKMINPEEKDMFLSPNNLSLLSYPSSPGSPHYSENRGAEFLDFPNTPPEPTLRNKSGYSQNIDLPKAFLQPAPAYPTLPPSLKSSNSDFLSHLSAGPNQEYEPHSLSLPQNIPTDYNKSSFSVYNVFPKPDSLNFSKISEDWDEPLDYEDLEEEEVDDDDDEDDTQYNEVNSPPLYRGASLTLHESLMSILTLTLKFSLSGQIIKSLLRLIKIHIPQEENTFKSSLFLFKKYFSKIRGTSEYTYYCSKCFTECEKNGCCTICKKRTPLCCLITLPLVDQIKTLMARPGFFSKLIPVSSRFDPSGNLSDIYDGNIYKEHIQDGIVKDVPHITGEWYADGAEAYKSAKVSVWNFFLSINELPYSERFKKENLLVPALWVGPVKPPASFLLKKSMVDFQILAKGTPMYIADLEQTQDVRFVVVGGTGDTPARALLLNMVAHNGEYPCQFCLQKGKCRDDCPGVRVLPYNEEEMLPRTKDNFISHGELAKNITRTSQHVTSYKGFHGTTPLSKITHNPVRATSIDSMHLIYGGSGKLNLQFFVDPSSSYTSLPCHLTFLERAIIDERLLQIKPPYYLTRVPKSIHEVCSWQTSIHKSMFLYYGLPVLQGVIEDVYFKHYATLIAATQYLNSDTITPDKLEKASLLLKKYARYFKDLYTEQYMTINFHLLQHLPDVVSEKGPLWTTACFPHEGVNGQILKLIHGPRYPEMQIASSVKMVLCQQDMINKLKPGLAKKFCEDTQVTFNKRVQFCYGENVIVGKWFAIKQPHPYLNNLPVGGDDTQFHCLRRKKTLYVAESYEKGTTRDSSAVVYNQEEVGIIKTFIRSSKCKCNACECPCTLFAVIQVLKEVGVFETLIPDITVPNTKEYIREEKYTVVPVESLSSVCVKMQINTGLFISKRCNQHEVE